MNIIVGPPLAVFLIVFLLSLLSFLSSLDEQHMEEYGCLDFLGIKGNE